MCDLAAKLVSIASLYGWRKRDRKCGLFGPLWVLRVKISLGAFRVKCTAPDLTYEHLRPWPFVCVLHETSGYWIREGISYLIHKRIPCCQVYHARRPMVPYRALPRAQDLGSERGKAMELLKKAWELATGVGNNKMKVCGHHAKRVYENTIAASRYGQGVNYELSDG